MITTIETNGRDYNEFAGLSTDTKPSNVGTGSIFVEVDTGKVFFYNQDGGTWIEQFSFQS